MATGVWVAAQLSGTVLHRGTLEALTFAQQLAEELGETVHAALVGCDISAAAEALGRYRLSAVHCLEDPSLASYSPATQVEALRWVLDGRQAAFVVLPHTYQTVDFLPRLAQRLDGALIPEVVSFRRQDGELRWRRPAMQGKMQSEVRVKDSPGPVFLSLQSGAVSAEPAAGDTAAPIEAVELTVALAAPEREILRVESTGSEGVDLSSAEIVVAVGRGVGDADKLGPARRLAAALGGELGASRPAVDSGWLPRELQIGSSGQTIAPKLYFAIGISGAIQHLVGMRGAQCVVAINKDRSAPIFRVARYGIVADLHEVVPALVEALRSVSD